MNLDTLFLRVASGDASAQADLQAIYEGDDPNLKADVGTYYAAGTIIDVDQVEAIKWWDRAADEGSLDALRCLKSEVEEGALILDISLQGHEMPDGSAAHGFDMMALNERVVELARKQGVDLKDLDI